MSTNSDNFVKIGPVSTETFRGICQLLLYSPKVVVSILVISGVTGLKFTKFYTM